MFDSRKAWRTSRPRFWIYLIGPFLVGTVAAWPGITPSSVPFLMVLAAFFAWPANLLVYGLNDAADYATDRLNPKKAAYETLLLPEDRRPLAWLLALSLAPFVAVLPWLPLPAVLALLLFVCLAVAYSVPPLRTKARPFADAATNVLYVCPALVGYFAAGGASPDWRAVFAACLWAMAMHAYSAVPDINADRAAGLQTIATALGMRGTLAACLALYVAAAVLALPALGAWSLVVCVPYVALMAFSLAKKTPEGVFGVYRVFPLLNTLAGAAVFAIVAAGSGA